MTEPIHPLADIEYALARGPYPVVRDDDHVSVQFDPTGNESIHVEAVEGTFIVSGIGYDGRGGVAFETVLFESAASTEYVAQRVLDTIAEHAAEVGA